MDYFGELHPSGHWCRSTYSNCFVRGWHGTQKQVVDSIRHHVYLIGNQYWSTWWDTTCPWIIRSYLDHCRTKNGVWRSKARRLFHAEWWKTESKPNRVFLWWAAVYDWVDIDILGNVFANVILMRLLQPSYHFHIWIWNKTSHEIYLDFACVYLIFFNNELGNVRSTARNFNKD